MLVSILKPEGYCSGVSMAIDLALRIKEENKDKNVYVLGMLVHNTHVTNFLKNKGIVTLDEGDKETLISSLNKGDILIFTAHGHEKHLDILAKEKGLIIYDSVCPKVKHNLTLIQKEIDEGHQVIYIGKNKHQEAIGALSISSNAE
jgi:4-hydroxy-3-methylbut-2-enyl diphosphate reductase